MSFQDRLADPSLFRQAAYIGGQWCEAYSRASHTIRNPSTRQPIGSVPDMGEDEAQAAVRFAEEAGATWRRTTGKERAALLRRWFDLIMANQEDLAAIMTAEQGKPLAEARGEIAFGAAYVEWYAEEAKRTYGDIIPAPARDRRILVVRQPIGVVAAITPWNFPFAMVARKCAPALAAGCTVIVKPAEQTPFSALALAELAHRAGIPPGVFNIVTTATPAPIGTVFATSPAVRKLTFTGSTPVGKHLMKLAADTVKKVTLELGGHAPFLVFADADLDAAAEGAIASKFRTSGQTCVCANRIFVQRPVYEAFIDRFAARTEALTVGDGFQPGIQLGPLIDDRAVAKVERHVQDALAKGARLVTGGGRHPAGESFYRPTVLADVTTAMIVTREETFGPVAPVIPFDTVEEAIAMANDSRYGLASYAYTNDARIIFKLVEELEAGVVAFNTGSASTEVAPAGGVKESGIGKEGGFYGIDEFLEEKYVCLAGLA